MTDDHLTAILAERAMGWKVTPDRIMKTNRAWISRWRFQPLTDISDAFELVAQLTDDYSLTAVPGGTFKATVRVGGKVGVSSCLLQARAITLAIAQALGIDEDTKR